MSNLYRLEATIDALARQFGIDPAPELPVPSPGRPGEPGLIVRAVSGQRSFQARKFPDDLIEMDHTSEL
jgi:hypothetical protein